MTNDVTGVESVQNILNNLAPKHARNLARATIQGIASEIAKDARTNAPRDTGDLRKAIKVKRRRGKPDQPISDVMVEHGRSAKHDAFYWRFVEYGTAGPTGQPERPFIRPAAEKMRANFPAVYREQFGKKLEAMLRRDAKKRAK